MELKSFWAGFSAAILVAGIIPQTVFADLQPGQFIVYTEQFSLTNGLINVEYDDFGASVDGAGDVNNDGYADLIVGAYRYESSEEPFFSNTNAGSAQVFSGLDGTELYRFEGTGSQQLLGFSVSGARDFNNDGFSDFMYSSPGGDYNNAVVRSGIDGTVLHTFNIDPALSGFGFPVDTVGDINNDNVTDIIIGGRNETIIYSGLNYSELLRLPSPRSRNNGFETRASGIGDINNDGYDDVIIGLPDFEQNGYGSKNGKATVYSGLDGTVLNTIIGQQNYDQLGYAVSAAGDVNNDGQPDYLVSGAGGIGGQVIVYSGADHSVLLTLNGASNTEFGLSVSDLYDVNNDGYDDFLVGIGADSTTDVRAGAVQIISGFDGTVIDSFFGDGVDDIFGASLNAAGDVNGDGIPDFIAGTRTGAANADGYARVFVSQIVPEPTSCAVFMLLLGLGVIRRQSRVRN